MRLVVLLLTGLLLGSCGLLPFGDKPAVTVPNVPRERSVDPATAARLINAHREARGRPPLVADPRLSAIAADTARELARRNVLKTEMHTAAGLGGRLERANYRAGRAAENLGAGYPTLVLAVDGWKASSEHNRNLLNEDFSRMGIGLALTDEGPFHSFWVLILARPDEQA